MLLEALVACAGMTLKAVATALEIELRSGKVKAEGDLDFRGTMGVRQECACRICRDSTAIRVRYRRRADKLIQLTERYCVVLHTISKAPKVTVSSLGVESIG